MPMEFIIWHLIRLIFLWRSICENIHSEILKLLKSINGHHFRLVAKDKLLNLLTFSWYHLQNHTSSWVQWNPCLINYLNRIYLSYYPLFWINYLIKHAKLTLWHGICQFWHFKTENVPSKNEKMNIFFRTNTDLFKLLLSIQKQ